MCGGRSEDGATGQSCTRGEECTAVPAQYCKDAKTLVFYENPTCTDKECKWTASEEKCTCVDNFCVLSLPSRR
jgi:hypothetical protein